jgi:hypothetical protein
LGRFARREKFSGSARAETLEKFHNPLWSARGVAVVVRGRRDGTRIARENRRTNLARTMSPNNNAVREIGAT